MSSIQYRLPVLCMNSRESQRKSDIQVRSILGCNDNLNVSILYPGKHWKASPDHFLCIQPHGDGLGYHGYKLVEMRENFEEVTLDTGSIDAIFFVNAHGRQNKHTVVDISSKKLRRYRIYCKLAKITLDVI